MPTGKFYHRHRGHAPKLRSVCDLKSPQDRFWEKVKKTEFCWEWQGYIDDMGYGRFHEQRNSFTAHRASYEFVNGRILNGLWVLHTCDNRKCVRPDHLFLGTPLENIADMIKKKRHYTGPHPWKSALTERDVVEIRRLRKEGLFLKTIAKQFGVTTGAIGGIVNRKTWFHVE